MMYPTVICPNKTWVEKLGSAAGHRKYMSITLEYTQPQCPAPPSEHQAGKQQAEGRGWVCTDLQKPHLQGTLSALSNGQEHSWKAANFGERKGWGIPTADTHILPQCRGGKRQAKGDLDTVPKTDKLSPNRESHSWSWMWEAIWRIR